MATIAVLGGAGFIGRRLGGGLRRGGHDVRIVDVLPPSGGKVAQRQADVRDRDALAAALEGSEVVYNLAAVHRDDMKPVTLYDEVNVVGAVNVCGVCRELGIGQLIFTSSVAVYGLAAPEHLRGACPRAVQRLWTFQASGRGGASCVAGRGP